mgnify:FL=1|jgi:cell division inhibitor SepF
MAGILKRGISWLGLGPEDDYDEDYDEFDDEFEDDLDPESAVVDLTGTRAATGSPSVWPVRPHEQDDTYAGDHRDSGGVRFLPNQPTRNPRVVMPSNLGGSEVSRQRSTVRPIAASTKPHLVVPTVFNDVQEIGDRFKKRQPVIVNLQEVDRDLRRRLVDFSSGVAYGLSGTVERVGSNVYLLTPADMQISESDRRRLREDGLSD